MPSRPSEWRWLRRVAQGLGIPAAPSRLECLVRLVFKPPAPGRRDLPLRLTRVLLARIAAEWGLPAVAPPWHWLGRALLRPVRRMGESAGCAAARHLAQACAPLIALWHAARRLRDACLARLPWTRWGGALERAGQAVGARRWLLPPLVAGGLLVWLVVGTSPLSVRGQWQFLGVTVSTALLVRRLPGRVPGLLLSTLSLLACLRYAWWRGTQTLDFMTPADTVAGYLLYFAEAYTWLIQLLGFVQTAWPLERAACALPEDPAGWPTVDIFIPSYNEALSVVKPAVFAAQGLDWPAHKLRIYLLDDGNRPAFREFARAAGIGYLAREGNAHAKAGNINSALARTQGDYIAIFDCDHVPVRSFLQATMGTFVREPRCAMVQTPHHFFSPDPFERNLATFHRVPNEGYLFHGLVQSGNDLWNASFFCGSCAILRRAALEEIGGIAVETVTEDAHTALKLHRRGYTTAYLPMVQAAGLATESLAGHIKQRIRWARGMAQIFRLDNPFLGRGLSVFQRLCYGNAMLHFFCGIPRLVFLTMPMAYLFFGMYFIHASAAAIISYVLPYLMLSNIASSRTQRKFRHSYWADVYESVLAWYIALPTAIAVISPRHGKFDVTDKGGRTGDGYLAWGVARPYVLLLALNALALLVGMGKLWVLGAVEAPTVLMNMFWTVYNLVMLGAAVSVAREARQMRENHRVSVRMPATLLLADGTTLACMTRDYSVGGLGLTLAGGAALEVGQALDVCVGRGERTFPFPVRVIRCAGEDLGVCFDGLTLDQQRQLVQVTFGRADAWLHWHDEEPEDMPLRGMKEVLATGVAGYARLFDGASRALRAVLALDWTRY